MPAKFRDQMNFQEIAHVGGTACDPKEDRTRQEFKKEADVNWLLKKYGGGLPVAPVTYGEQDFDIDLLTARQGVSRLSEAYKALPEAVRQKYPDWDSVLKALEAGTDPFAEPVEPHRE